MIPGFIITWLTFPGVIVHEFAHKLFCHWTGTPVLKVCYFRFGNPAGYVIHGRPTSVWRHILIGIGPFFVNTLAGFALGIPLALAHTDIKDLTLLSGIWFWLAVSIAMHSFPSTGDAKGIWHALWSNEAPVTARVIGSPLVVIIFLGAFGSIFWLDLIYGIGVVLGLSRWAIA